MVMERVE
jgi:hypothetical protein